MYYYDDRWGSTVRFEKIDDQWILESWGEKNWSKMGSADDIIWPYVWHSAEGLGVTIVLFFPLAAITLGVAYGIGRPIKNRSGQ